MSYRTVKLLVLALLLFAAAIASAEEQQVVRFLGMQSKVPADWVSEPVTSNMRLLQFAIPAAKEADAVQFVVYYFGPKQGGSVEANLQRWKSQFSSPDGGEAEPQVSVLEDAKLPATLIELEGTYARGVGIGPQGEALPERMLLAAVVESPKGNIYPQLHGPAAAAKDARAAFVAFIEGIKKQSED